MLLLASSRLVVSLQRPAGHPRRCADRQPQSGRDRTDRLFVNTQVLKADLDGQMTFAQLLQHTKRRLEPSHRMPFDIVEALQPERSLSHNPLFQVLFNHQNDAGLATQGRHLPDLRVEGLDWGSQTAQFDLTWTRSAEGLWASLAMPPTCSSLRPSSAWRAIGRTCCRRWLLTAANRCPTEAAGL